MATLAVALQWSAIIIFGLQWIAFLFSAALRTEKFFDFVGSLSFFLTATISLTVGGALHARQVMVTSLVSVWAVRLGSFLLLRIIMEGKDRRFDSVRDKPIWLFIYWSIQAFWIFVTSIPVLLLNFREDNPIWMQPIDVLGISIWMVGFAVELISDLEKFQFRLIPENKEKWIDSGLWRYSRHPNYVGEILMWVGIYFACSVSLNGWALVFGLLSPLYVYFQLVYMSGLPLLETAADAKWGSCKAYLDYKRKTPVLFPTVFVRLHAD